MGVLIHVKNSFYSTLPLTCIYDIYCKLLLVLCRERLQVGVPHQVPDATRSCNGYRVRIVYIPFLHNWAVIERRLKLSLENISLCKCFSRRNINFIN